MREHIEVLQMVDFSTMENLINLMEPWCHGSRCRSVPRVPDPTLATHHLVGNIFQIVHIGKTSMELILVRSFRNPWEIFDLHPFAGWIFNVTINRLFTESGRPISQSTYMTFNGREPCTFATPRLPSTSDIAQIPYKDLHPRRKT